MKRIEQEKKKRSKAKYYTIQTRKEAFKRLLFSFPYKYQSNTLQTIVGAGNGFILDLWIYLYKVECLDIGIMLYYMLLFVDSLFSLLIIIYEHPKGKHH